MNTIDRVIARRNGCEIRIIKTGRPDVIPVLVLHGTPASRLMYAGRVEDAQARGIRLISYDRPGYGGSTPQPGRTVASAAEDVATIAEAVGCERLLVWGISGDGPHALACAALLPDLVVTTAMLASLAPHEAEGLDWFAGMGEDNITEFSAALQGREAIQQFVEAFTPEMLGDDAQAVVCHPSPMGLSTGEQRTRG